MSCTSSSKETSSSATHFAGKVKTLRRIRTFERASRGQGPFSFWRRIVLESPKNSTFLTVNGGRGRGSEGTEVGGAGLLAGAGAGEGVGAASVVLEHTSETDKGRWVRRLHVVDSNGEAVRLLGY